MLYALSKIVPVLMRSNYTEVATGQRWRDRWIQWGGRIFFYDHVAVPG